MPPKRSHHERLEDSEGGAHAAVHGTEEATISQQSIASSPRDPLVLELTSMFRSYFEIQQLKEEKAEREGAKQEQRWKTMPH
ncbi:hypothetical protein EOD39_9727 [Acipenser ruthenus]|uniref:Uncharacterized protein n=1 Tax=Acipenser ruthenus TaxID=7906 RepID=A0A444TZY8_ACIRT|nr:hypothetical protein EOD39_9727 [Acipenser ruthenus]